MMTTPSKTKWNQMYDLRASYVIRALTEAFKNIRTKQDETYTRSIAGWLSPIHHIRVEITTSRDKDYHQ